MKCPYCAEEIQDAAILCRFCGATRRSPTAAWIGPGKTPRSAGTIKLAGVLYIVSAMFELFSLTSGVPLFGAVRTGAIAVGYHLLFAVVFIAMGVGLVKRERWAPAAVFGGTAIYTVDRLLYLFDREARAADVAGVLGSHAGTLPTGSLVQMGATTAALMIACAWAFAGWIYLRRADFTGA